MSALNCYFMLLALGAFICVLAVPSLAGAQSFKVDLARMADQLEIRYEIAEKGELPPGYILIGPSFYPNFLESKFDLRKKIVEYDYMHEIAFIFRYPGDYRFMRREERKGAYYTYSKRDYSIPGLEVTVKSIDDIAGEVRRKSFRDIWLEEVKYGLRNRQEVKGGGGGLISIDMPIPLPKTIERIIGKGEESNLSVQGSEEITIGGESNWCSNCPYTEGRPRQQKFPDLDMQQKLTVSLKGTIGEKINVEIQHSNRGQGIQSTNRVRVNYRGFDDEIVKLIEMGDTDLMLSGAQLVSYSGAAKGLFGVKGMAQVGPVDLTVIASKEESETASGSFSAQGGESSKWTIADYDFISRQFFYFETPGSDFTNPIPTFFTVHPVIGGTENDEIEVFESLRNSEWGQSGVAEYNIKAYVDPENNGITGNENYITGRFKELILDEDYELIQDYGSKEIRYIGLRLFSHLDKDRILAVRYKAKNDVDESVFLVGDYKDFSSDTLTAELICPPYDDFGPTTESSPFPSTWNMMMRNVYSLGTSNIDEGTLDVKIEDVSNRANKDIHPQSHISYLRLFGLDRYDRVGDRKKDDQVDNLPGILNLGEGYLMFPWYEPFNPPYDVMKQLGFIDMTDSLESKFDYSSLVRDSLIYKAALSEEVKIQGHHYNIIVEASSGQRVFQLNAFDIIEGSEVVTVDGTKLARGIDYDIDYQSGMVTLKGDILTEMTPDSKVRIDYQHKPLVGGGKNSLLGVGARINLSQNSRINAAFIYNSTGAPKYTPRLGEEPSRMMAADINGSFKLNPKWMTSVANVLPLVESDAKSNVNISGELAMSFPNPNVKGEAFIDDMEGIEDSDVISMIRRSWYEASPPLDPVMEFRLSPADMTEFYWYNASRTPQQGYLITTKQDLNPRLDDRENSSVTTLFLKAFDDNPGPDDWCGVMTGFPGGGLDLTTAEYLEIWVNDYNPSLVDRGGTIHIDFGKIDEDFYQPDSNRLNDEDKPPYTWTSDEDTGFEGETCTYPKRLDETTWDPVKKIYRGIDCRKENGIHDSEDLNQNARLDTANAYYSLELNLSQSALIDVQRDFPKSKYSAYWGKDENNKVKAWRMYRLDLSKAHLVSPSGAKPRWDAIQHLRVWIEHPDSIAGARGHILEITGLKFVGNKWIFNGVRDLNDKLLDNPPLTEKITLGTINNKDDPAHYSSPYKVEQEEGIENREQSLLLKYEGFEDGTSFKALKRFYGTGRNFQQYRQFQFFLRPDYNSVGTEFYIQIAYDSLNYYEIAVPFNETDAERWMYVVLNLSDLTNLKINAADTLVSQTVHDAADPSKTYTAKLLGNPTLFQVRYLYMGLRNKSGGVIQRGEVWVDDLKLGGTRRDIDHAERASIAANFANILQVNGSWQRTGPEFRNLRQKRGSGVRNSSLMLNGKTSLNYFVPTLGFNIPLSFKYGQQEALPKYIPQSDVEIMDSAVRDSLKSISNNYSLSVSLSRRGSKNFLMKNLFDNLKTSYTYSKRSICSPTTRDTTWSMSGNLNYQIHFSKNRSLKLFKGIKWRYWLSSFSLTSVASRRVDKALSLSGKGFSKRPTVYSANWKNNMNTSYEPFESMKIDFKMNEERNLAVDHYFHSVPIGVQTRFGHNMQFRFQPTGNIPFLSDLRPNFQYSTRYSEDINPNLRQGDDPFGTRNVGAQRNINLAFDFDFASYTNKVGEALKLIKKEEERVIHRPGPSGRRQSPRKANFNDLLNRNKKQPTHPQKSGKLGTLLDLSGQGKKGLPPSQKKPSIVPPPVTPPKESAEKSALKDLGIERRPVVNKEEERGKTKEKAEAKSASGADTTKIKENKEKADPLLVFRQMFRLFSRVETIKTNININHQSSYQRIYDRTSIAYQLGLTDRSGVKGKSGEMEDDPDKATNSFTLDLRSGYDVSSNIDILVNLNLLKRSYNYSGRLNNSYKLTWPSLSLSWNGLEKLHLLKNFVSTSNLNVNFERTKSSDARGEETSYRFNPIWSLTWKNSLSTNLSFSMSQTSSIENSQKFWNRNWAVTLNLKYTVKGSRGFSIPLPLFNKKQFKFSSTLTTNLDLSYMSSSKYNQPASNVISVSPRASYRFSNRLTGSMFLNYKRTSGGLLGYKYQTVGLGVSAEFRF